MKIATIEKVFLDDTSAENVYRVVVSLQDKSISSVVEAYPLNTNIKVIPVVGEQVLLFSATRDDAKQNSLGSKRFYYTHPLGIHNNINHNALPNLHQKPQGDDNSNELASLGIPRSSKPDSSKPNLGNNSLEVPALSQIQPFLGDVIHEGRFGQSIRFGYTPQNTKRSTDFIEGASESPSWVSTDPSSPITIIRNGAGESRGYNKFVIEDINKDDSSIWLGSKQTIGLTPSNSFTLGVTPTNLYKNPQIVLNSDRIVLNSKSDSVLISGDKSVNVSTPNWKADMDTIFSQLEAITDALLQLAPQLTAAVVPVGPVPVPVATLSAAGPQLLSTITQVKTQLTLMKQ